MDSTLLPDPIISNVQSRRKSIWKHLLFFVCWGYLLLLLALIYYIRRWADVTVPATFLLFSPRWVWLLPLGVLTPLAIAFSRQSLRVLLAALFTAVFPLMGFCVGWHRLARTDPSGMLLRVVAFNLHQNDLQTPEAERFFADQHPDLVGLEEAPVNLNRNLFPAGTWHCIRDGEQVVASRYPIISRSDVMGGTGVVCVLSTPRGPIKLIIVHLASPHYALRDSLVRLPDGGAGGELLRNISQRKQQAETLKIIAYQTLTPLVIAGDFNLPSDSQLFTSAFANLVDSFAATEFGFGWTYRNDWTVVRIDHVLTSHQWDCKRCFVGPYLGSPHRPIISDLILKNSTR